MTYEFDSWLIGYGVKSVLQLFFLPKILFRYLGEENKKEISCAQVKNRKKSEEKIK